MAEPFQPDVDAFIVARDQARQVFNATMAPALAHKQAALDAYRLACQVADTDPANTTTWATAAAARVNYLNVLADTNNVLAAATAIRDAAINAAAATLDKAIAATAKKP